MKPRCSVCGWTPDAPRKTYTGDDVCFLTDRKNLCNQPGCVIEYQRRNRKAARDAYFRPLRTNRAGRVKRRKKVKGRAA